MPKMSLLRSRFSTTLRSYIPLEFRRRQSFFLLLIGRRCASSYLHTNTKRTVARGWRERKKSSGSGRDTRSTFSPLLAGFFRALATFVYVLLFDKVMITKTKEGKLLSRWANRDCHAVRVCQWPAPSPYQLCDCKSVLGRNQHKFRSNFVVGIRELCAAPVRWHYEAFIQLLCICGANSAGVCKKRKKSADQWGGESVRQIPNKQVRVSWRHWSSSGVARVFSGNFDLHL